MTSAFVVGAGPAGLGFAHEAARQGFGRDVVLAEAGPEIDKRSCLIDIGQGCRRRDACDVLRGVGGSAALAGGKISGYPAGTGLVAQMGGLGEVRRELDESLEILSKYAAMHAIDHDPAADAEYAEAMARLGFNYKYYPAFKYRQSDLQAAWNRIAAECRHSGVTIHTGTTAMAVAVEDGEWRVTTNGVEQATFSANDLVLASGRGRTRLTDSLTELGLLVDNPSQVGIRVEFPTSAWPAMDRYHNDLKLKWGHARTYCASKDGEIAPYWSDGILMSEGKCDLSTVSGRSSIAILVSTEDPSVRAETVRLTRQFGQGRLVREPLTSYLGLMSDDSVQPARPSSSKWFRDGRVAELFPASVVHDIKKAVSEFANNVLPRSAIQQAWVFGPEIGLGAKRAETRSILATGARLWAVGDVSGAYRGILQSFAAGRYLARTLYRGRVGRR